VAERFTRADVDAIAALANLELDEAELELFARQLGEILSYAEEVQRIDTTGVPPTASVVAQGNGETSGLRVTDRDDREQPGLDRDAALANAPDPALAAGLFKVPRVIGSGAPDKQ
jgi:aspartyl-tRNA(Asn)/glutamyl-tRNA(Gln) amidotransferase subunit C